MCDSPLKHLGVHTLRTKNRPLSVHAAVKPCLKLFKKNRQYLVVILNRDLFLSICLVSVLGCLLRRLTEHKVVLNNGFA